jgi:DNA-binding NarL/FixJ family response regulator
MPVRVVLADDHLLVREGIQRILATSPDVEMVGAVSDGDALRDAIEELNPDVIVTDIRMPPSGRDEGLQIADTLRSKHPTTGLLVLSQYADPGYALALFSHGSNGRGYLLKDRLGDGQQLLAAIVGIAAGGSVIDPMVIEVLLSERSRAERSLLRTLTPREQEILAELASGKSNAAIARELFITRRSVEHHVSAIFSKLALAEEADISRRVHATLLFLADREPLGVNATNGLSAP